jgi:steroid 5-alpha reductase family enzyme
MHAGFAVLIALIGMSLIMLALWYLQLRTRDPGVVDVAWGLGVAAVAVFLAWNSSHGDLSRRLLVSALIVIWSLRLSGHVLLRLWRQPHDGRYEALQRTWGSSAAWRMLRFYQMQGLASVLFALPVWIAATNPQPLGWHDLAAGICWLAGIAGETLADAQLARFRASSENRGRVCQVGLWYFSRHPNYFFEWLHWCSYPLFAWGSSLGILAWIGPWAMYYFITQVTGIPPTEAQALRSRGEAYREYQQTTNAFFPGLPRRLGDRLGGRP